MKDVLEAVKQRGTLTVDNPYHGLLSDQPLNQVQSKILDTMIKYDRVYFSLPRQCGFSYLMASVLAEIAERGLGGEEYHAVWYNHSMAMAHCMRRRLCDLIAPTRHVSNLAEYNDTKVFFENITSGFMFRTSGLMYNLRVVEMKRGMTSEQKMRSLTKHCLSGKTIGMCNGVVSPFEERQLVKYGFHILELDWRWMDYSENIVNSLGSMPLGIFLEEYQNGKEFHVAYSL